MFYEIFVTELNLPQLKDIPFFNIIRLSILMCTHTFSIALKIYKLSFKRVYLLWIPIHLPCNLY